MYELRMILHPFFLNCEKKLVKIAYVNVNVVEASEYFKALVNLQGCYFEALIYSIKTTCHQHLITKWVENTG